MNYCYICNQETDNAWVCQPCVQQHDPFVRDGRDNHCYSDLLKRHTPHDPVPEWVRSKYHPDPDLAVDVGL